jgi:hypothetical protein
MPSVSKVKVEARGIVDWLSQDYSQSKPFSNLPIGFIARDRFTETHEATIPDAIDEIADPPTP